MELHAGPAILGDVRLGRGSLGVRSWQGLDQDPRGQDRARSLWPGGHWLWHKYQAPKQVLDAIRAASTPTCMPLGLSQGEGATSPIWPSS